MCPVHRFGRFAVLVLLSLLLCPAGSRLIGADVLIDDATPTITFDDTDNGAGAEWSIFTSNEGQALQIFDHSASQAVLEIFEGVTDDPGLRIMPDGLGNPHVGIGSFFPEYPLHVVRDQDNIVRIAHFEQPRLGKLAAIGVHNDAPASNLNTAGYEFVLNDTVGRMTAARVICSLPVTNRANATSALLFQTRNDGDFATAMRFEANRVSIGTNASTHLLRVLNATCNGTTWADASSRKLKENIVDLAPDAARKIVMGLNPVSYTYRQEPSDQRLGFIAEDVPEAVAMPGRETLSSLDIIAAMAKVMQEQERENAAQRQELELHRTALAELRARLAALESQGR